MNHKMGRVSLSLSIPGGMLLGPDLSSKVQRGSRAMGKVPEAD